LQIAIPVNAFRKRFPILLMIVLEVLDHKLRTK